MAEPTAGRTTPNVDVPLAWHGPVLPPQHVVVSLARYRSVYGCLPCLRAPLSPGRGAWLLSHVR